STTGRKIHKKTRLENSIGGPSPCFFCAAVKTPHTCTYYTIFTHVLQKSGRGKMIETTRPVGYNRTATRRERRCGCVQGHPTILQGRRPGLHCHLCVLLGAQRHHPHQPGAGGGRLC